MKNHKLVYLTITEADVTIATIKSRSPHRVTYEKMFKHWEYFNLSKRLKKEWLKWKANGVFTPGKYGIWINTLGSLEDVPTARIR